MKCPQESHNRFVCIVRVLSVSVRGTVNSRTTGLVCIVRVLAVSLQSAHNRLSVRVTSVSVQRALNNPTAGLCVLYE